MEQQKEYIIPIQTETDEIPNTLHTSLTTLTINEPIVLNQETSTDTDSDTQQKCAPATVNKKLISIPIRHIPPHNVPERIILCLDTCADPEFTAFKLGDGSKYAPLYMLKRTIELFVQNKNYIDPRHEFALLGLDGKSVKWIQDFTNNPRDIINALSDITQCEQDDEFDLSILLDSVWQSVHVPKPTKNPSVPPQYVVRLILLYSRSYCTPVVKRDFKELLSNPYFTIDVLMTHEELMLDNKCQEIFDSLLQMDEKGYSYNFAVGRNPTKLHDAMAKLLAHPLERPPQLQASYKAPVIDKDE